MEGSADVHSYGIADLTKITKLLKYIKLKGKLLNVYVILTSR